MPTCVICLDLLKDPAALPCGHVFCYQCIVRVVRSITPYTHNHFCPTCRQSYTIAQVDPALVPHHLQQHVGPAVRRLHLEYSVPNKSPSTASSSDASECDRLRAEVESLRNCCLIWRKRAAVHAAATLGLVGLARLTRDGAIKMKAERDAIEAKYQALKKTFQESQTLSTFPPTPPSQPEFCERLCETPLSLSPSPLTHTRATSQISYRLPSPTPSDESYCSDCSECRPVNKRKREESDDMPILKRTRSNTSPSPEFARLAIADRHKTIEITKFEV